MSDSSHTLQTTLRCAVALHLAASLLASTGALAGSVPVTTEFTALTGNSTSRGELGTAVAVMGERVFLGAPAADVEVIPTVEGGGGPITVSDAGVISRWERNSNDRFAQVGGAILPGSVQQNGRFGTDMATSADFLAVTQANPPTLGIYLVGTSTNLQSNLLPMQLGTQGNSNRVAAAIFNNHAAVGVVRNYNNSGSVEIYTFSAGQWTSTFSIDSPLPTAADLGFGYALSMTADSLFVGVPALQPVKGNDVAGAVFEYRRPTSGTTWNLESVFELPFSVPLGQPARLGLSVHSAGNLMVAGAPGLRETQGGVAKGGVLVYELDPNSNSWEFRTSILNPVAEANAEFGYAVATDGSKILVGAPGSNAQNGRSYLYVRSGPDQWTLSQEMVRTATGPHRFGAELAFTGTNTAIIAAPQFAQFGGAAYEYRFTTLLVDGFE